MPSSSNRPDSENYARAVVSASPRCFEPAMVSAKREQVTFFRSKNPTALIQSVSSAYFVDVELLIFNRYQSCDPSYHGKEGSASPILVFRQIFLKWPP